MITYYPRIHTHRRSQVEIDPAEGSPKVDFRMMLVLRSDELARTAYPSFWGTYLSYLPTLPPKAQGGVRGGAHLKL